MSDQDQSEKDIKENVRAAKNDPNMTINNILDDLNSPFKTNYFEIWFQIVRDGVLAGIVFVMLFSGLTIVSIFAGKLNHSSLYVAAMGIGCAYFGVGSSLAFGLNAGFNVISARCNGVKDNVILKSFLRKQFITINFFSTILGFYCVFCWFWFGHIYKLHPQLCYYSRMFMVLAYPTMICVYNIDVLREMFLGVQVYVATVVTEFTSVFLSVALAYFFTFICGIGFFGLILGLTLGQMVTFVMYYGYFLYGKEFKKYRQDNAEDLANRSNLEAACQELVSRDNYVNDNSSPNQINVERKSSLTSDATNRSNNSSLNYDNFFSSSPNKPLTKQQQECKKASEGADGRDDIEKLSSWKGFLSFEGVFVTMMFLELFWGRLDTLIASVYFKEWEIATQSCWMNLVMFMDAFSYGYGIACAAKISKHMVNRQVKIGAMTALISNVCIFGIGIVFGLGLYINNQAISNILIDDPETRKALVKINMIYSWLIPMQLLQGSVYATLRAIGKQNYMIGCQIFANYIIHFGVLYTMLNQDGGNNAAIVVSCGATFFAMTAGSICIILFSDWNKAADKIAAEMENEEKIKVMGSNGVVVNINDNLTNVENNIEDCNVSREDVISVKMLNNRYLDKY